MVLRVITVIQKQKVIYLSIVTDYAASVLVITLQVTQSETYRIPWQIDHKKEAAM